MTDEDEFQSPRGDFGFLKTVQTALSAIQQLVQLSIPSRGFWFFEGHHPQPRADRAGDCAFQSPRGDFGFLKF